MTFKEHFDEELAAVYDSLSDEDKSRLKALLEHGFDSEAARRIFDEGIVEEESLGTTELPDFPGIRLIPSAVQDLEVFVTPEVREPLERHQLHRPSP